ncbi:DUF6152 family protein [Variovorax paradoxus]|uniref:Uncharacterized protein n=1 Tax=Variovorax paradoxus (strain EPS) TaxID=595537 RepID=E6VA46_VARPE|nr:DUF6152 family protein [Variovorax paradoxus]ADU37430.1 hypothetical protein Varpa_3244 [Variovorax paradoxus EPS]
MMQRRLFTAASLGLALPAWAHHGWSSFDQERPLYLEGRATKVLWRNPHGELELELPDNPALPADLKQRALPKQTTSVDGPALLAKAQLPTRRDRKWQVELAPLTRLQAWGVEEIKPGTQVGVLGFTFTGEKGDAVLRAEYLFVGGKAYGLRSSPA